jgi:Ca2+-binding RTX toxin-like protein
MMAELASSGLDYADFWSVEDRTMFSLARHTSGHVESEDFLGLSYTGEAFRMMNESLRGKTWLQLYSKLPNNSGIILNDGNIMDFASGTDLRTAVEAFSGDHELVLFVSNRSGENDLLTLDLAGAIGTNYHVWATKVSAPRGHATDQFSIPIITNMSGADFVMTNGILSNFSLNAWESLRITVTIGAYGAHILGYTGNDDLTGGNYGDVIDAKAGEDTVLGGGGNDTIYGHDGNDFIYGGDGDQDLIFGGNGNDQLDGGATGGDTIYGDFGNDSLYGGNGSSDVLYGGEGDDELGAGTGDDTIDGGAGNDTALFWGATAIRVDLAITVGQATGYGIDTLTSIEIVKTGSAGDILYGNTADNQLFSGTGNDTLDGRDGDDSLYGGAGVDYLSGGNGNDYINAGNENDFIFGGAGNDRLTGGLGRDWFTIVSGSDTIADLGLGGADVLTVAAGAKVSATLAAAWTATGASSNEGTANLISAGFAVDLSAITSGIKGYSVTNTGGATALTGSGLMDRLWGGVGNGSLSGGGGDDVLVGGAGNDVFIVGSGTDTISDPGLGTDASTLAAWASANASMWADWTASGGITDAGIAALTSAGFAVDLVQMTVGTAGFRVTNIGGATTLTGSGFDDTLVGGIEGDMLFGGTGNDSLVGNDGEDRLMGGAGINILTGGAGADTFVFDLLTGAAHITDFTSGSDHILLAKSVLIGLGSVGTLTAADFWSADGAVTGQDTSDRVIYNTATGALYYDADGSGVKAAFQIAVLDGRPPLAYTDVFIF